MSAFKQMAVVDVLLDSTSLTDDQVALLKRTVKNLKDTPIDPRNIPRNSLLVRSVHGNESQMSSISEVELVLPFFSPHICPPVKPGEIIWAFFYDADEPLGQDTKGKSNLRRVQLGEQSISHLQRESMEKASGFRMPIIGYWIGRVTTFMQYDDINYTVLSRAYELNVGPDGEYPSGQTPPQDTDNPPIGEYFRTAPNVNPRPNVPSIFSNGAGVGQPNTLEPPDSFKQIFDSMGTANGVFEFEPVPRFTKRPGDTVLQGSNNTLISLGTDRTGPYGIVDVENTGLPFQLLSGSDESKPEPDFVQFAGTIDIVAGRGRVRPEETTEDPELTAPRLIETDATRAGDRKIMETDKDPTRSDKEPHLTEGDPDFLLDHSRIYVSMRTNGDVNFFPDNEMFKKMETANTPESNDFFKDKALKPVPRDDEPKGTSYVVMKSDEIRIIARKNDDLTENPDSETAVNGSIRIVKEGTIDDDGLVGDRAAIIIHPDGTVQIDAPRIILGRKDIGSTDEDAEAGAEANDQATTGYVMFSKYNEQMGALHDEVADLADKVGSYATDLASGWGSIAGTFGASQACGFMPIPMLSKGAQDPADAATTCGTLKEKMIGIKNNVDNLHSKIPEARSKIIFGE